MNCSNVSKRKKADSRVHIAYRHRVQHFIPFHNEIARFVIDGFTFILDGDGVTVCTDFKVVPLVKDIQELDELWNSTKHKPVVTLRMEGNNFMVETVTIKKKLWCKMIDYFRLYMDKTMGG